MAGFTKDDRIPQPLSIFDNERVRFEHRFSPFFGLSTPPPVSYNQFKDCRNYTLNRSSMNLYLDASNYFHRARTILEVIPNADAEVCFAPFSMAFYFGAIVFNFWCFVSDCGHNQNCKNQLRGDESLSKWSQKRLQMSTRV